MREFAHKVGENAQVSVHYHGGEDHGENSAYANLAPALDLAVVVAHDGVGYRQAESGAAIGLLGGKEGLEEPLPILGLDADAGIFDLDDDVATLAAARANAQ